MAKKKILVVGASGYGNVGDDTYRIMFQHYFGKKYDLRFCNSDLPGGDHPKFPQCDAVVMGGGGLMYAMHDHFKKMVRYLKQAEKRNIPYAFISVGYQFKPMGSGKWIKRTVEKWEYYVKKAVVVTIRSEEDLAFTRHLGKEDNAYYFPDLCYGFSKLVTDMPCKDPKRQICIVPGAGLFHFMDRCSPPVWAQQQYTLSLLRLLEQLNYRGCKIVRMGAGSADNAKIRLIRKMLGDEHMPTYAEGDPRESLRQFASSEIVISGRYHGLVFSRSIGVPVITMPAAPYKILTEDKDLDVNAFQGHIDKMNKFLQKV